MPLVGSVPLDALMVASGESGLPAALGEPGPLAEVFAEIAERVATEISPVVEMTGCSARMLEHVAEALRPSRRVAEEPTGPAGR